MRLKSIYGLSSVESPRAPQADTATHYLYALLSIEQHALEIDHDATKSLRIELRSLHRDLADDCEPAALDASKPILDQILRTYRDLSMARYGEREADIRDILAVMGSAAESLGSESERHNCELKGLTDQLQSAARLQELSEVRRALRQSVSAFRQTTDAIRQDHQRSVAHLQTQLDHFQDRLNRAEKLAATDELTGLLNRREGENRLNEKVAASSPFCLMLLDLDRFKSINDQNGHSAGDQVLRILARKLTTIVCPGEVACRWGGDEFALIMDGPFEHASRRAGEIQSAVSGRYTIYIIGREVQIQVGASFGVAEYTTGESAEHLFARADQALYTQKHPASRIA
jgi:diguanylate cyclase